MSSPVRPPLTVTDGTTEVRPTNKIVFDAADGFSVTKNGSDARIDFTGGGSASLTDTFIGFGDASNSLTGSANFTFTEESGGNGPAVLLTGDKPVLKLQDDTAGTNYRTEFLQSGASQYINSKDSVGTNNEMFRIDPTYIAMQRSMTANVGIGTIPTSNVQLHVKGTGTDAILLVESTDTGANSAPDFVLLRDSTSPADGDFVGIIDFKGNDDGGNEIHYGRFGCQIKDSTAGTHDGSMFFVPARDGSVSVTNNLLKLSGEEGAVFNENGLDNFDFRIESDAYSKMFFIDAGLNKAHFGTGGIDNALGLVQINVGNSTQNALTLTSTDADAAQAPTIEFYRNSSSPAVDDKLGQLNFTGKDLNGDKVIYAQMYAQIDNAATGSHDGRLVIDVVSNAASPINVFRADKDEVIINDVSFALDTRIESNGNENAIFVDGSEDLVGIMAAPSTSIADNNPKLQVEGSITGKMPIVVQNSNVTLTRAGLSGQTYVCTDGGTTALTMPLGAEQGDYFYFVSTSGSFQIVVDVGTQTLNGGTSALTRGTNNEVYTVICVEDNKFILSNPA